MCISWRRNFILVCCTGNCQVDGIGQPSIYVESIYLVERRKLLNVAHDGLVRLEF